jgi:hypothetical protein
MKCRHCATALSDSDDVFIDLGTAPPSNAFLSADDLGRAELHLPLKVLACRECGLVQIDELQRREQLFCGDYVYFSSYSSSWLAHADRYVEQAVERLGLGASSRVMEVASNDGYLLQFVARRGIPCVGVEPTAGTAAVARAKGIETIGEFFGREFARRFVAERGTGRPRSSATTSSPTVPDIDDFVAGLHDVLAPGGTVTGRVPAPAPAGARGAVRHRLPRALLVSVAPHGRADLRRPRPGALGRRDARHARRIASRLGPAGGALPGAERACRRHASPRRRSRHARQRVPSRAAVARRSNQGRSARLSHRAEARRQASSPATAPRPRATRC